MDKWLFGALGHMPVMREYDFPLIQGPILFGRSVTHRQQNILTMIKRIMFRRQLLIFFYIMNIKCSPILIFKLFLGTYSRDLQLTSQSNP